MYADNMRTSHLMIPREKIVVRQMIELQFSNKDFLNEITKFRNKYKITYFGNDILEKYKKIVQKQTKEGMSFHVEIYDILRNFHLNDEWYPIIFEYITKNKYSLSSDPECMVLETEELYLPLNKWNKKDFYIKVHPSTTKRDLIHAWGTVKDIIKNKSKLRPIKYFDESTFIYDLKTQGKKNREIRKLLTENYNKSFSDSEISKVYIEMKKRIDKN